MEKVGIKETKELLKLVLTTANVGIKSYADNNIGVDDLKHVMDLVPVVVPAFADLDKMPAELLDLSAEELAELVAMVSTDLLVDDVKAKLIIEKSLKVGAASFELVKAIVG